MLKKLYKKIEKNNNNDMAADVAQWKCSNIKCYVSAFSNILIWETTLELFHNFPPYKKPNNISSINGLPDQYMY